MPGPELDDKKMIEEIASKLPSFKKERSSMIPLLQYIQERYSYLAPEVIKIVAGHLDVSVCEVYGVATFYNQFRFNPPGRRQIKVCLGTACHVKGGDIILENFERKLGVKAGETTADREFSIDKVACVGCCALAPVALIDDEIQAYVSPSKVEGVFVQYEIEKSKNKNKA